MLSLILVASLSITGVAGRRVEHFSAVEESGHIQTALTGKTMSFKGGRNGNLHKTIGTMFSGKSYIDIETSLIQIEPNRTETQL